MIESQTTTWGFFGAIERLLKTDLLEVKPDGLETELRLRADDYVIEVLDLVDNKAAEPEPTPEPEPEPTPTPEPEPVGKTMKLGDWQVSMFETDVEGDAAEEGDDNLKTLARHWDATRKELRYPTNYADAIAMWEAVIEIVNMYDTLIEENPKDGAAKFHRSIVKGGSGLASRLMKIAKALKDSDPTPTLEPTTPDPTLEPEPQPAPDARFSPDDTVYLYWLATEQWEPVNYRGPQDDDKAVVVKDGRQMTVPMADLRAEKPTPAPEPEPEPSPTPEDPQTQADRTLLQSVIDGTVADILSADLGEQLMELYERHGGEDAEWADPELKALAEAAMDAYEAAEMAELAKIG